MVPGIPALGIYQVTLLLSYRFASTVGEGALTCKFNAARLNELGGGLRTTIYVRNAGPFSGELIRCVILSYTGHTTPESSSRSAEGWRAGLEHVNLGTLC